MILSERDGPPATSDFDVSIVAVGYEQRCTHVVIEKSIVAATKIGLEFGFLESGSFPKNREYFQNSGYEIVPGLSNMTPSIVASRILETSRFSDLFRIFVDISSMSREMIANVVLGIGLASETARLEVTAAYAPSRFEGQFPRAPIRVTRPITPSLAGWSSQPEQPLGAIFGLGCEPDLALGALQVLEPDTAWAFNPHGIDARFDEALEKANQHVWDIFDVVRIGYDIDSPSVARGRYEALLNAIDRDYRIVTVPFGPKIFSWSVISTVVFTRRRNIGVWTFSSRDHASLVDRKAEGPIFWHSMELRPAVISHRT